MPRVVSITLALLMAACTVARSQQPRPPRAAANDEIPAPAPSEAPPSTPPSSAVAVTRPDSPEPLPPASEGPPERPEPTPPAELAATEAPASEAPASPASRVSSDEVELDPRDIQTLDDVRAFLKLPELAEARAFAINVHEREPGPQRRLLDEHGIPNPDRLPVRGATLSVRQLAALMRILTAPSRIGPAFCFEPHHAVVLLDAENQPLGEITICFECGRIASTVGDLGETADFDALARLLRRLRVPLRLPIPGKAPKLSRPQVHGALMNAVRQCRHKQRRAPEDPIHGALALEVEMAADASARVRGVEGDHNAECLEGWIKFDELAATKRGSVHRFDVPAAGACHRRWPALCRRR